jgi:hypothetical protein
VLLLVAGASMAFAAPPSAAPDAQTMNEVRKQLVTLPYYGVSTILPTRWMATLRTLSGQVVRPMTSQRRGAPRCQGRRCPNGGEQHRSAAGFPVGRLDSSAHGTRSVSQRKPLSLRDGSESSIHTSSIGVASRWKA